MNSKNQGFTLVEILVVLAIIVVLSGIVVPLLARAKGKAAETTCLVHISQVGRALQLYSVDNNFAIIPTWGRLQDTLWLTQGMPSCPSKSQFENQFHKTSGFAVNMCLGSGQVDVPSEVIMATDVACTWIQGSNGSGPSVFCSDHITTIDEICMPMMPGRPTNGPIGSWGHTRHFGGANYLFVDGRVKAYRKTQLQLARPDVNMCRYNREVFEGPIGGPRFAVQ